MNYKTINEECEKIKQIYGEDITIDVKDKYYLCNFRTEMGWFEFLISTGKVDEPHGLEFSVRKNDKEKVKNAILALKGAKYGNNNQ